MSRMFPGVGLLEKNGAGTTSIIAPTPGTSNDTERSQGSFVPLQAVASMQGPRGVLRLISTAVHPRSGERVEQRGWRTDKRGRQQFRRHCPLRSGVFNKAVRAALLSKFILS